MTPALWALLLFVLAIAFFCLEFFIPSSGALGFLAAASAFGSAWMMFHAYGISGGTIYVMGLAVLIPVLIGMALKWWPYTPLGRRLLNIPPLEERDEVTDESYEHMRGLVGERGISRSLMMPSGIVEIHGQSYDAVAESGSIEKGELIQVVRTEGLHMVVRRIANSTGTPRLSDSSPIEDPFAS